MRAVAITLCGPMASWGDIAIGEVRPSLPLPTRSALLGLAAACLGVERGDEAGWNRVTELAVAVQVEDCGTQMKDYHTVMSPKGRYAGKTATRRAELQLETATTLTYRDYICDGEWTAVYWPTSNDAPALEELVEAFRKPKFTPFLGRKSCALMMPLGPELVEGDTLDACLAALEKRADREADRQQRTRLRPGRDADTVADVIWCDRCDAPGLTALRTETRHDDPVFGGRFSYSQRFAHGARAQHVGRRQRHTREIA